MINLPEIKGPSCLNPYFVVDVKCVNPRNYHFMEFPITIFLYERHGVLIPWVGYPIHSLSEKGCISSYFLKENEDRIFSGYVSAMALLRLSIFDITDINLHHHNEGVSVEAVQGMAFDLARSCAKYRRQVLEKIKEYEREKRVNKYIRNNSVDQCSFVYPRHGGYMGD